MSGPFTYPYNSEVQSGIAVICPIYFDTNWRHSDFNGNDGTEKDADILREEGAWYPGREKQKNFGRKGRR